jgi:epoxyqueuosine reductase
MGWLKDRADQRADPQRLWPDARSAIVLGHSYAPDSDPLQVLARPETAAISVYAQGKDYHDVIKPKLKQIARQMVQQFGGDVKVFVDTAPLMEKPLAQAAGLGWQGKHTNLVSRPHGSWLFLGAILTTLELEFSEPEIDHCGSCSRCLDICPTQAFVGPYRLDARKCISYLTIEHRGMIDQSLRPLIGNRIYGCDDCLAVCPWNKFASAADEAAYRSRPGMGDARLEDLLQLDDVAFRLKFSGSPIKRIGRDRFIRNVLIAAGNSGLSVLVPHVRKHLDDTSPIVRGTAVWALSRLLPTAEIGRLKDALSLRETDTNVMDEWNAISGSV